MASWVQHIISLLMMLHLIQFFCMKALLCVDTATSPAHCLSRQAGQQISNYLPLLYISLIEQNITYHYSISLLDQRTSVWALCWSRNVFGPKGGQLDPPVCDVTFLDQNGVSGIRLFVT